MAQGTIYPYRKVYSCSRPIQRSNMNAFSSIIIEIIELRMWAKCSDKSHSRSSGPNQLLTRQPSEGRSRDGGLRFGEMERDCMLSHGSVGFLKERMFDSSDKYIFYLCKKCGMIASGNKERNIFECRYCDNKTEFSKVQVPYASKLLIQEIQSMGVRLQAFTN